MAAVGKADGNVRRNKASWGSRLYLKGCGKPLKFKGSSDLVTFLGPSTLNGIYILEGIFCFSF